MVPYEIGKEKSIVRCSTYLFFDINYSSILLYVVRSQSDFELFNIMTERKVLWKVFRRREFLYCICSRSKARRQRQLSGPSTTRQRRASASKKATSFRNRRLLSRPRYLHASCSKIVLKLSVYRR